MTKNIAIIAVNLVTPKARAKHEHLFNELASELCQIKKADCPTFVRMYLNFVLNLLNSSIKMQFLGTVTFNIMTFNIITLSITILSQ